MKFSALIISSFFVGTSAVLVGLGDFCQDDRMTIATINNVRMSDSPSQLEASLPLSVVSSDGSTVTFRVCQTPNSGGAFWTEYNEDSFDSKCVQIDPSGANTQCKTYTSVCQTEKKIAVVDLWAEGFQTDIGTNVAVSKCCEVEATAAKITYELKCECPPVNNPNLRGTPPSNPSPPGSPTESISPDGGSITIAYNPPTDNTANPPAFNGPPPPPPGGLSGPSGFGGFGGPGP